MRLDVGPVASASAEAWMEWADETFREGADEPVSAASPSTGAFSDVAECLQRCLPPTTNVLKTVRWHADVDADELEYLLHAFFLLDSDLADEGQATDRPGVPDEGRSFHLVLVRDILHALETQSQSSAAFVDHLRSCWPSAAEAC